MISASSTNGEFGWIAEIDRAGAALPAVHEAQEAVDEIVDKAERAGLRTVAIDRDGLPQGLDDEIGNDAAVVRAHARAVGIEDAADLDLDAVVPVVVEEQRFGAALAFVVTGARAERIDIAPVGFVLRMCVGSP